MTRDEKREAEKDIAERVNKYALRLKDDERQGFLTLLGDIERLAIMTVRAGLAGPTSH